MQKLSSSNKQLILSDKIGGEIMSRREELKEQIDELMRQYRDGEIDADTYKQEMMELTTSVRDENDND
jgi:predicted transcriptional regulator